MIALRMLSFRFASSLLLGQVVRGSSPEVELSIVYPQSAPTSHGPSQSSGRAAETTAKASESTEESGSQSGTTTEQNWRPLVIMHGMNQDRHHQDRNQDVLKRLFPGIYITSLPVYEDFSSMVTGMDTQMQAVVDAIRNDTNLKGGFNFYGESQGALIARAYVTKYNDPPVYNLVALNGPQNGVGECPKIELPYIKELCGDLGTDLDIYHWPFCAFCDYWKGTNRKDYLENSEWLTDINNDIAYSIEVAAMQQGKEVSATVGEVKDSESPALIASENQNHSSLLYSLSHMLHGKQKLSSLRDITLKDVTKIYSHAIRKLMSGEESDEKHLRPESMSSTMSSTSQDRPNVYPKIVPKTHINETYRQNMLSLNKYMATRALDDEIVQPGSSAWHTYWYWDDSDRQKIMPLNETLGYIHDVLGLKTLMNRGDLILNEVEGQHLGYNMTWWENVVAPLLGNKMDTVADHRRSNAASGSGVSMRAAAAAMPQPPQPPQYEPFQPQGVDLPATDMVYA